MEHHQLFAVAAYLWAKSNQENVEPSHRREVELSRAKAEHAGPTVRQRLLASFRAAVKAYQNPGRVCPACAE